MIYAFSLCVIIITIVYKGNITINRDDSGVSVCLGIRHYYNYLLLCISQSVFLNDDIHMQGLLALFLLFLGTPTHCVYV
jgi:hypothetical protein